MRGPCARRLAVSLPRRASGEFAYWAGLPLRWGYQALHNSHGILRVCDIVCLRPLPAGLVGPDHPWVTGRNPATGRPIWPENVVYRTPPSAGLASDAVVLTATGKFLAERVRQSAVVPELPCGPKRRMPHGINYIHGASHYNSGLILLNDFAEGYRHVTCPAFRREVRRFVRREKREVLFLFRDRRYEPRDYADFSCCVRTVFPWFCNPNGPNKRVLWGNAAPFPAANLITGRWVRDVYALKAPGGAAKVVRPPIEAGAYFQAGDYAVGRDGPRLPERLLARLTAKRIGLRGERGGMFFVDRRKVYADQLARLTPARTPRA